MQIPPILAALRKHRIPAALIVLEIALACAVLCNAVFMISQRIGAIHAPDAIDESGLSVISVDGGNPDLLTTDIPRNLATLRGIPGVSAAAAFNSMPLTNNGWNANVSTKPDKLFASNSPNVMMYIFTQGGARTLGLRLLHGRLFSATEFADSKLGEALPLPTGHEVVVTSSLAKRLWPERQALGQQVWIGNKFNYTVVGVVADVLRPGQNGTGPAGFHWAMFFPVSSFPISPFYVLRSAPQDRARVILEGVKQLESLSPNAVVKGQTFSEIRAKFFATTRSMVWMLVLVCVVMLAVTAFGIVGLTSFWVGQRRRQIGIRRAVGATRAHILNYFQTENFLLSTAGVVIGMALAFGINLYLMQHYQMLRMPWYYLPVSAIALWILGQLAVLGPALRAANVPPVVATREG